MIAHRSLALELSSHGFASFHPFCPMRAAGQPRWTEVPHGPHVTHDIPTNELPKAVKRPGLSAYDPNAPRAHDEAGLPRVSNLQAMVRAGGVFSLWVCVCAIRAYVRQGVVVMMTRPCACRIGLKFGNLSRDTALKGYFLRRHEMKKSRRVDGRTTGRR
jgi:hypothetical protein